MTIFGCEAFSLTHSAMWKVQKHSNTSDYWWIHTIHIYALQNTSTFCTGQPCRNTHLMAEGVLIHAFWLVTTLTDYLKGEAACISASPFISKRFFFVYVKEIFASLRCFPNIIIFLTFTNVKKTELTPFERLLSLTSSLFSISAFVCFWFCSLATREKEGEEQYKS